MIFKTDILCKPSSTQSNHPQLEKRERALAKNDCPNGKQHEGILPQERLHVIFGDVLYFLFGLQGTQLDVLTDPLHPAARARVLPFAFGHAYCSELPLFSGQISSLTRQGKPQAFQV